MSILKKFLEKPTPFSKIKAVDYFGNSFVKGFTRKMINTDFVKGVASKYSRLKFERYDPNK